MALDVVTLKLAEKYCDEHGGSSSVSSVNGKTGAVVLGGENIDLFHEQPAMGTIKEVVGYNTQEITNHKNSTTNPHSVTAEQTAYDSTAASHTSGSVAAQLASHSSQIGKLGTSLADAYDSSVIYTDGAYAYKDGELKQYTASTDTWTAVQVTDIIGNVETLLAALR